MTRRLYYSDSYLMEFTAEVLELRSQSGRNLAILDRTAFYPTSGGQPHDIGRLGQARVLSVEEDEVSGLIFHQVDTRIPPGPVVGVIDWDRRFDHMQQHSGQHILSQAFLKTAGAQTLSFHLGMEYCTIDIALTQPTSEIMRLAEDCACAVVFENRATLVHEVAAAELASVGIRKETQREGIIRVVEFEGFDRSACGGTHVRRAGEIGMIAVLGFERYKGGTRVEFVCGGRALKVLRADHEALGKLGRLFSAHPHEVQRLAERLFEERSSLARENNQLREKMLELEALDFLSRADKIGEKTLIKARFPDRSLDTLKTLAQKIVARGEAIVMLAAVQESAQIVVAKSSEVPGNCGDAIKQAAAKLGGKGGGRPDLAQAGGIPVAAVEAWFQTLTSYFLGAE